MDDIGKDIEKLLKAGLGAVSEGLNRSADLVDMLAEKGEPLYQQARESVNGTADKMKKTVSELFSTDLTLDQLKQCIAGLNREELREIAAYTAALLAAPETQQDGAAEGKSDAECGESDAPCEAEKDSGSGEEGEID